MKRVPLTIPRLLSDYGKQLLDEETRMANLLAKNPVSIDKRNLIMIERMKPIKLETFKYYWKMMGDRVPMHDIYHCEYEEWADKFNRKCQGWRNTETGKDHGYVRRCWTNIIECTYLDGKRHGFNRSIWWGDLYFSLYRYGEEVAVIRCNMDLEEVTRSGEAHLLPPVKDWVI